MKHPESNAPKIFVLVHVCRSCGVETPRENVSDEANMTGEVRCPACGFVGPLQVSISEQPPKPSEEKP